MQLTPHQNEALSKLKDFIQGEEHQLFVLSGYAGTGKTTLVSHLVQWLQDQKIGSRLLATTGRAAKVLQDKTKLNCDTLHSEIYEFSSVNAGEKDDDADLEPGQMSLNFGLKSKPKVFDMQVYIVDESSMISHLKSSGKSVTNFGTGSVLNDFLTHVDKDKVIFVGDPCQLPPISDDPFSSALSPSFLAKHYEKGATGFELKEIIRQAEASQILTLAGKFRQDINRGHFVKYPKVPAITGKQSFLYKNEYKLVDAYMARVKQSDGFLNSTMIASTNKQCHHLNANFRHRIFKKYELQEGELLMVVQNNYIVPLTNGDQVLVEKVKFHKKLAGFTFLEVKLKQIHSGKSHEMLMIKELLYSPNANLNKDEMQRLLISYDKRARQRGHKRNSKAYLDGMKDDKYLNALRCKFSYAITCHKSQGGEWDEVFLNIYKSLYAFRGESLYRWYYTAITRAKEKIHINDGWWVEGFDRRRMAQKNVKRN